MPREECPEFFLCQRSLVFHVASEDPGGRRGYPSRLNSEALSEVIRLWSVRLALQIVKYGQDKTGN
jgi:hypothetical protein